MKRKIISLLFCLGFLFGCSPKTPEPRTSLTLKQLMDWVIDPNADVIWDSVKTISNIQGTKEIYPHTETEWEAVRNSAATLIEAGNGLADTDRAKDNKQWSSYANQLSKSAELALKAAQEKDKDALFDAGGTIYNACKGCHDRYANFDKDPVK